MQDAKECFMRKPRILIVEDDMLVRESLASQLAERYEIVKASCAGEAQRQIRRRAPELCLMDVNLPDMDGYTLCREIRREHTMPIIFLTVRDDEASIVCGLEVGGDDYVVKPFSYRTLQSRIMAQLRRAGMTVQPMAEAEEGYRLDEAKHLFSYQEQPIEVTPIEFEILRLLMARKGCLVSREQLLNRIWDAHGNFVEENTLSVTISRLRRKLTHRKACPIETVHGLGYRWRDEA